MGGGGGLSDLSVNLKLTPWPLGNDLSHTLKKNLLNQKKNIIHCDLVCMKVDDDLDLQKIKKKALGFSQNFPYS